MEATKASHSPGRLPGLCLLGHRWTPHLLSVTVAPEQVQDICAGSSFFALKPWPCLDLLTALAAHMSHVFPRQCPLVPNECSVGNLSSLLD